MRDLHAPPMQNYEKSVYKHLKTNNFNNLYFRLKNVKELYIIF